MPSPKEIPDYLNTSLLAKERAADLVSRMTLEEKVSQMVHTAAAIPRLKVPAYDWWNECLHGVGRAGVATVFPQAIGLAAMWDEELHHQIAQVISNEARAKHHEHLRETGGDCAQYYGLTFWSPNINLFRDPRWGRGQETYGEDPYLAGRLGVAFVKGLQGDDPQYLKLVATPKHFAVHSGPEADRHHFDARVNARDLWETYLPHFRAAVQEGEAWSVMPAYNRTNGEACGASRTLLEEILRKEWGFEGYVVSDCGAIADIYEHHKLVETKAEAAALAVANGCDLNCGDTYCALADAVGLGLIPEHTLDRSLRRLFEARFLLGMFDPPEEVPFAQIPYEVNDCEEHRELAREAARESIVLLKNQSNLLPITEDLRRIVVIGPQADDVETLLGNYNGFPSEAVTPLAGIRARAEEAGSEVTWAKGCELVGGDDSGFAEAVEAAKDADLALVILGLSPRLEGEEGEENLIDKGGDRVDIGLPGRQLDLLKAVHATGTPVVLILQSGSALAIPWAKENIPAILCTWYGGEEAGTALAEVLWGDVSPSGRLPVTFYRGIEDLPPFGDYSMHAGLGRTYRFFRGEPTFAFGHGLSYTRFEYSNLKMSPPVIHPRECVVVSVMVTNTGMRPSDEVVQLYVGDDEASVPVPIRQLAGFERVALEPGESVRVSFLIGPEQMACYTDEGKPIVEPGRFTVSVGGGQPLPGPENPHFVTGSFEVVGEVTEMGW
ncbi:MAG TPA: glycoside hydrolase family 3 C-terminal domain-containing protein [Armatimonadota bacterium]